MTQAGPLSSAECRELVPLETSWRSLAAQAGGPVEQFEWAASCVATGSGGDLRIATVTRDGRLVALGPFAVKRARGVDRRVMLGVDVHYEPMDLLALDGEALEELARTLARDRLPIEFGRLPADSPALPALRRAFGRRRVVVSRSLPPYPYIGLDPSWQEPASHLGAGRRSDLRRAWRRARRLGDAEAEILRPAPEELHDLLEAAFAIEARSWKRAAGTAIICLPAEEAFIRHYADAACRRGTLRLCFLRIGGRRVAMQIAMVAGGGFWLLKIGYDAEFARCSPGVLLLSESIADAARQGLRSFEFLGRHEPWIGEWATGERPTVALRAYPLTPVGSAALASDAAYSLAKRLRRRSAAFLPPVCGRATRLATPMLDRIARRYVAGATLGDAMRVTDRLAGRGVAAALGFWDGPSDHPRGVADNYLAGLDALASRGSDDYLSIKLPALDFSRELLAEVAERARALGVRVHLDSLAPGAAAHTRAVVEELLGDGPWPGVGYTLPGRWRRSLDDAEWACDRGLPVRVVKGEWPDPGDPDRDPLAGYLELVDRLCGRAVHVGVATHDPRLAAEAVGRLRRAGTPCGLELLYGLPQRTPMAQARRLALDVRVYVPYGHAYPPYPLAEIPRRPRMALWLARDLARSMLPVCPG